MVFLGGPTYVLVNYATSFTPTTRTDRGAIQEYQTQLVDSVNDDIKYLHEKVRFFSTTQKSIIL